MGEKNLTHFSELTMRPHVSGQFAALGAGIGAQLAFVRFFAGMRSQMDD